ncbi:hypothetical protein Barb7_01764 [Bacteroidales bacterium Barb7]|nr:hypothetical protein Barb7_01764 [Bacteroidales bacterium Barb7]
MRRVEGMFGERGGTQSILIGDHHIVEVKVFANEIQVAHHLGVKLQLLWVVQLVINGRLFHQRPVPIDKQQSFFHGSQNKTAAVTAHPRFLPFPSMPAL